MECIESDSELLALDWGRAGEDLCGATLMRGTISDVVCVCVQVVW